MVQGKNYTLWPWPWKSIGFLTLLRTKYVPSLAKIHWKMLILECSQGCYRVNIRPCDLDLWPWKSIGFQIFLRAKYVPSLVKIHWKMLILECSQGCYVVKIWPGDLDIWPWKSIGKYVPNLVKIHWKMLILECSQGCYRVKIRPFDLDLWPWKSIGFQILLRTKYVPSLVKIHRRMLILECSQGCYGRTDGRVTISLRNFVGEGIITENQWKQLKPSTSSFKKVIFYLFWLCPAIFWISFSQKNSWNQLNNWQKSSLYTLHSVTIIKIDL
jgi:hypothetical protein